MSAAVNDPNSLPSWAKSTSGRSGASYRDFLAQHPDFDPFTNLESYTGAGGSQSAAAQQAFGWLNEWARNNGYQDGKNIPAAQRGQMYLAFLERAHQGMQDRGENWGADAASKIPEGAWSYTPGWGLTHGGQSYETQGGATGGQGSGGRDTKGQTGGSTVSMPVPPLGGGVNTGAGVATGPLGTAPVAGPAAPATPGSGGPSGVNAASLNLYRDDPQALWAAYAQAAGIPTIAHNDIFERLKSRLMPQLLAYVQAQSLLGGSADQTGAQLGDLVNAVRGGTLYGTLQNTGKRALDFIQGGGLGDTADQGATEQAIQQALGMGLAGKSKLAQSAALNAYQDMGETYGTSGLLDPTGNGMPGSPNIAAYMTNTPFWKLAQTLGLA